MEIDPYFLPDENLYLRVNPDHANPDPQLKAMLGSVNFPNFSVNRGKYSVPEDVLKPKPTWWIVSFQVKDIPTNLKTEDGRNFQFAPVHLPEPDNDAHSEVRSNLEGELQMSEPPKSLRLKFREELRQKLVWVSMK
jgi:hypothetical protein